MSERFESVVLDGHKGLAFEVPFDPAERWDLPLVPLRPGRRGFLVKGTVNRVRFESVVVPRARRFFVLVTDEMQSAAKLRSGSDVRVSLSGRPR
ncbi:MAG: DUF1905 domain-containing protein [Acidobacteriota bacterium]